MERNVLCGGKLLLMLEPDDIYLEDVRNKIYNSKGINSSEYYLIENGKRLADDKIIAGDIHCVFRTLGGKGGFGSMLRAIGAQIEKTTNREACRDLSGRRLRDINEEKRLKAWLDKQKDRETEAEEKRRKKLEKLVAVPKHEFKDAEYESARSELTEKVSQAVEEGFKKASLKPIDPDSLKRKATNSGHFNTKRAALWIADEMGSSSDDGSESNSDDESPSCSTKISEKKSYEDKSNVASTSSDTSNLSSEAEITTTRRSTSACESTDNPTLSVSDKKSDEDKSNVASTSSDTSNLSSEAEITTSKSCSTSACESTDNPTVSVSEKKSYKDKSNVASTSSDTSNLSSEAEITTSKSCSTSACESTDNATSSCKDANLKSLDSKAEIAEEEAIMKI